MCVPQSGSDDSEFAITLQLSGNGLLQASLGFEGCWLENVARLSRMQHLFLPIATVVYNRVHCPASDPVKGESCCKGTKPERSAGFSQSSDQ